MTEHVSTDLLWEITKNYNSLQVKRRSGGGATFTHDPFSLTNRVNRRNAGFISSKAIGISHAPNGGVHLQVKKDKKDHQPGSHRHRTTLGGSKGSGSRKILRGVSNSTAKRDYRPDLLQSAVARAGAIHKAQQPKKDAPTPKLRGAKAKAAAASS